MANVELARYHRLVLFPVVGIPFVRAARSRASTPPDRDELTGALRCQIGGAAVWTLHLVLQAGIGFVWWLMGRATELDAGLRSAADAVLWLSTGANVLMWVVEWGLLVSAGLRAANGHPYPLSRRQKRAAAADSPDEPAPPADWKPLSDG